MTLTELLITSSLMIVVLSAAYLMLNSVSKSAGVLEAKQIAEENARAVVERSARDFRQGIAVDTTTGVFPVTRARECWVYADVDLDGVPELVKWASSGKLVKRQVVNPSTNYPRRLADFTSYGTSETVATSIDASWTGAMFTYWSVATSTTAAVAKTSPSPSIASVEIQVIAKGLSGAESATVNENTWVRIRSAESDYR